MEKILFLYTTSNRIVNRLSYRSLGYVCRCETSSFSFISFFFFFYYQHSLQSFSAFHPARRFDRSGTLWIISRVNYIAVKLRNCNRDESRVEEFADRGERNAEENVTEGGGASSSGYITQIAKDAYISVFESACMQVDRYTSSQRERKGEAPLNCTYWDRSCLLLF